jgi:hypothetical protein
MRGDAPGRREVPDRAVLLRRIDPLSQANEPKKAPKVTKVEESAPKANGAGEAAGVAGYPLSSTLDIDVVVD